MAKSFVPKLLPNKVIAKDNEHRLDELQSIEVCNIVTSPFSHNMLIHTPLDIIIKETYSPTYNYLQAF